MIRSLSQPNMCKGQSFANSSERNSAAAATPAKLMFAQFDVGAFFLKTLWGHIAIEDLEKEQEETLLSVSIATTVSCLY